MKSWDCKITLQQKGHVIYISETRDQQPWSTYIGQISFSSIHSVALVGRKISNFAIFSTLLLCGGCSQHCWDKVNAGAQLQTFPYPTVTKLFPYSQRLHGEVAVTNFVFQKHDRVNKKQTKKHQTLLPWWHAKSNPHLTSYGDRGGPYHSCTSFASDVYFCCQRALKIWREMYPQIKNPLTM